MLSKSEALCLLLFFSFLISFQNQYRLNNQLLKQTGFILQCNVTALNIRTKTPGFTVLGLTLLY